MKMSKVQMSVMLAVVVAVVGMLYMRKVKKSRSDESKLVEAITEEVVAEMIALDEVTTDTDMVGAKKPSSQSLRSRVRSAAMRAASSL